VYSLGATFYELLTLRPAVRGESKADILRHLSFEEPVALRKLDKSIPAELETITLKCLAKNPNERYATAGELAADLRRYLKDTPIKAKPPSLWQRSARRLRRHPRAMATAFVVSVLAAIGAFASAVLIDQEKQHAQAAYGDARAAYARARLALDEMSSQVSDDWLAKQPALSDEQRRFLERTLGHYEWLAGRTGADTETKAGVAAANLRAGDIRAKLGQTAEAETAFARAVDMYQRLTDQFPKEPAYQIALAKGYRGRGVALQRIERNEEVEPAFKKALALHERLANESPNDFQFRNALAGVILDYGDFLKETKKAAEAERNYQRGLDLMQVPGTAADARPTDVHRLAQLNIHLGSVLFTLEDRDQLVNAEQSHERGIRLLEGLLKSAPGGPDAAQYREDLANGLTDLAHCLGRLALGRPKESEAADRRAVGIREKQAAEFPGIPEYRYRLAKSLNGLGNHLGDLRRLDDALVEYGRAITLLEKLMAEYPGEPRYRASLAEVFANMGLELDFGGRPAEAAKAARRVVELTPDDSVSQLNLGIALVQQGRVAVAEIALRRATELAPNDVVAHGMLGEALLTLGRNADAEIAFRRATELAPNNVAAHRLLGKALLDLGRNAVAEVALRRYVALAEKELDASPDDAWRQHVLAWFLATCPCSSLRDPARAVQLAKQSVINAPKENFQNTLGVALYRAGNWKEAVAALEKSLPMNKVRASDDGFFLAMAHWQLGDHDQARKYYALAVVWMEKNEPKDDALVRFRAEAEELLGTKTETIGTPHKPPKD
jgi:tetratricopeptide (TPR) repeat protein